MRTLFVILPLFLVSGSDPKVEIQTKNVEHTTSFVVYPADTNHLDSCFGGKLLAEMDKTCGIACRRLLYDSDYSHAVTVGIEKVTFHNPARVGDLLFITATVVRVGDKSITLDVKIESEHRKIGRTSICSGTFTFVAYDIHGKKAVPHGIRMIAK